METNEPADIVDRRMRVSIMDDIKALAEAADVTTLRGTELCIDILDYAEAGRRNPAMTAAEHEAALEVAAAIKPVFDQAFLIKRQRLGGKVVHGLDASLGWFSSVQPVAASAWALFQQRGWMNEDDR
jgi:hypothetical protein